MSKKSYEVKRSNMSDDMQREALQCVLMAEYMYKNYIDIATYITKVNMSEWNVSISFSLFSIVKIVRF